MAPKVVQTLDCGFPPSDWRTTTTTTPTPVWIWRSFHAPSIHFASSRSSESSSTDGLSLVWPFAEPYQRRFWLSSWGGVEEVFVFCCGCITSQQSLTQTCTNKSKHVIDWWDSVEINPERQESGLNFAVLVVGEASLRILASHRLA